MMIQSDIDDLFNEKYERRKKSKKGYQCFI